MLWAAGSYIMYMHLTYTGINPVNLVNVINRRSPSNKMRRQLQPKKTKVRLY